MKHSFKVEMTPIPKQYQRIANKGGRTWAFTPSNVLVAQRNIASVVDGKGVWFEPHVGVRMDIAFYRAQPDTPTLKRVINACKRFAHRILPVIPADIDNYSKLVMDALHDICYSDDCQITQLNLRKRFIKPGEKERIEFSLQEDLDE